MTYDELLVAEPTLSPAVSQNLFFEIMATTGWRCYSTAAHENVLNLVDRFLRSHAKIPGIVSPEMLATFPVNVFRYDIGNLRVLGGTFLNGAVAVLQERDGAPTTLLCVDEATATQWSYPQEFGRLSSEATKQSPHQT